MREIEVLAEEFLSGVPSYIWDGETLPVPVEDIADSHLGLLVRDVDSLELAPGAPSLVHGQTLSGVLLPGIGEIWVSAAEAREWPPRRRFTIAHEIGHWQMHRNDDKAAFCRSTSVEPAAGVSPHSVPPAEDEANRFAAGVLMPAHLLRREYVRLRRDFVALCQPFNASGAAMGRRLHAVIQSVSES
jgi:IrrE N-terminal-like domain